MGIVCHCAPLRPPRKHPDPVETELRRKASGERNEVEATFGTVKRVYRALVEKVMNNLTTVQLLYERQAEGQPVKDIVIEDYPRLKDILLDLLVKTE